MVTNRTIIFCYAIYFVIFIWIYGILHLNNNLSAQTTGEPIDSSQSVNNEWNGLISWIDKERQKYKIPGMAVAIVKENKILLKKTFGYMDIERKKPVSLDTVFPIGSSAKPFTATLAAMLVTDGTMRWDDPITKYLPYFRLKIKSDNESDQVTIRDLLSHRTGFFTMELVQNAANWEQDPDFESRDESERYSRESLLRAATELEPKDRFREIHNYSNISMLAVAMASGEAAGMDWDTLMANRMFKPLGMTRSSTSIAQIRKGHDVATGYLEAEDKLHPAMLINMDVISPAGGINSTINDMAMWLRFILSKGMHQGKRLIGKKELYETWTKQIDGADIGGLMPGASYGLGWFITEWKDKKVVEHPGNALGYSVNVAFIPDDGIGYVMLSNCMTNPRLLSEKIWEALLN